MDQRCGECRGTDKPARLEYHGTTTHAPDAGKVGIDMKTKQTKIIEPTPPAARVEVFPAFRDIDGDWYETPVVLKSAYDAVCADLAEERSHRQRQNEHYAGVTKHNHAEYEKIQAEKKHAVAHVADLTEKLTAAREELKEQEQITESIVRQLQLTQEDKRTALARVGILEAAMERIADLENGYATNGPPTLALEILTIASGIAREALKESK